MDKKIYVWLFQNLERYNFTNSESEKLKAQIKGMLVTEASVESPEIGGQMKELYDRFVALFYNNAVGYRCGLCDKPIEASELDCYFLLTADGMTPIGYYKIIRPMETAIMVQKYLKQCESEINGNRNAIVARWQGLINQISKKFDEIKNEKYPSRKKAAAGLLTAAALTVCAVLALFRLDVLNVILNRCGDFSVKNALKNIPLLTGMGREAWVFFLIFSLVLLIVAVLTAVLSAKEILLLNAKAATGRLLYNGISYVKQFEQQVASDIEIGIESLYTAGRGGGNAHISKGAAANTKNAVERNIKIAYDFVNKKDSKRTAIPKALIIAGTVLIILSLLPYSRPLADAAVNVKISMEERDEEERETQSRENNENSVYESFEYGGGNDAKEEYQDEQTNPPIPKVSEYFVHKSDATWAQASDYAKNDNGYLVSINDREEFEKVCKLADDNNIKVFWVGATRKQYDDWENVHWQDGTPLTFTNWLDGEPSYYSDDTGEDERCLMVFKVGENWFFNDSVNNVSDYYKGKMGYIVEVEK